MQAAEEQIGTATRGASADATASVPKRAFASDARDEAVRAATPLGSAAGRIAQRAGVVAVVLAVVTIVALGQVAREHRDAAQLDAVVQTTTIAGELVADGYASAVESEVASADALAAALLASGAVGGAVWHTGRGVAVSTGTTADEGAPAGLAAEVLRSGRPRADEVTVDGRPAVRVLAPVARTDDGGIVLETITTMGTTQAVVARERTVALGALATATLLAIAGLTTVDRRRDRRAAEQASALRAMVARDARTMMGAADVDRIKGDFLTAVSHEVRTPLHLVRGTAQLLATRADAMASAQVTQLATSLGANAERLDSLLTDLLDLDRLGQGVVESRREPVAVADALDTALRSVDLQGATMTREVADVVVQSTPAHIERILEHLVRNAVKYGTDGTTPATITVQARRTGEATHIVVTDDGPGIPAQERIRVFDPLYRVHDDRADPGSGIGLALVRRLTRLYGGRTWVEDAVDGGAALHVQIPDAGEPLTIDTWNLSATVDARRG